MCQMTCACACVLSLQIPKRRSSSPCPPGQINRVKLAACVALDGKHNTNLVKSTRSFRNTIDHSLTLRSVYRHVLPGSDRPEVTTLHSELGATVDYIFYTAGPDHRGRHQGTGHDWILINTEFH